MLPIKIASTRFNCKTFNENEEYRIKILQDYKSCIYGTPIKIRNTHSQGCLMFIVEMNNDTNKIEGIGLVQNNIVLGKYHKIYSLSEYNRYVYKGKYRICRETIWNYFPEVVEVLDFILFKGKGHLKRQSGISVLRDKLFNDIYYKNILITKQEINRKIHQVFVKEYG